jgi:hypothetical protein
LLAIDWQNVSHALISPSLIPVQKPLIIAISSSDLSAGSDFTKKAPAATPVIKHKTKKKYLTEFSYICSVIIIFNFFINSTPPSFPAYTPLL